MSGRLTKADEHLRRVDHVMRGLIDEGGPIHPERDRRASRPDPYEAIARAIVGQQLSTKAARSIWERLLDTLGGSLPPPSELLEVDPETLRGAGLSRAKAAFMRDLAERIDDGRLDIDALGDLIDEDVVAALTEV